MQDKSPSIMNSLARRWAEYGTPPKLVEPRWVQNIPHRISGAMYNAYSKHEGTREVFAYARVCCAVLVCGGVHCVLSYTSLVSSEPTKDRSIIANLVIASAYILWEIKTARYRHISLEKLVEEYGAEYGYTHYKIEELRQKEADEDRQAQSSQQQERS